MNNKDKKIDKFIVIISIIVYGIIIIGFIKAPVLMIIIILLYWIKKHSYCGKTDWWIR